MPTLKAKPASAAHITASPDSGSRSFLKKTQFSLSRPRRPESTSPRLCSSHGFHSGNQLSPWQHISSGPWEEREQAMLTAARLLSSALTEQRRGQSQAVCRDPVDHIAPFPVGVRLLSSSGNYAKPLPPLFDLPLSSPTYRVT